MSEYLRETFSWLMGKTRRRDNKDNNNQSNTTQEASKDYYLQDANLLHSLVPESKLKELVKLPNGIDQNEWLALHTIAFFENINLLYGTISEFCTNSGCPEMIGPENRLYLWQDDKGKRLKLTAPHYTDFVMTYTHRTINDESIFPTKFDKEFPPNFDQVIKKIHQSLIHVLSHIYHSHFREIYELGLHPHLNCIFSHLVLLSDQFKSLGFDSQDSSTLPGLVADGNPHECCLCENTSRLGEDNMIIIVSLTLQVNFIKRKVQHQLIKSMDNPIDRYMGNII